jgi:Flp pilus assembly protein TadG
MAFALPVILALLFGMMEVGWMLLVRQTMQQASRAAVRVLAIDAGTNADAITAANTEADKYIGTFPYSFTKTPEKTDASTTVKYKLTISLDTISLTGDPLNLFTNKTLTAEAVMRKEESN